MLMITIIAAVMISRMTQATARYCSASSYIRSEAL